MTQVPVSFSRLQTVARELGFQYCGFAPAEPVSDDFRQSYLHWLAEGKQGEMRYLENHLEKRFNPRLLVEGTQTIVSLAMNYRPHPDRVVEGIAWYAQGVDYHEVLRERMQQLMQRLELHGRCFVDTAPVPERYWAVRCGLGWIGRHGQLVIPGEGSTFFLGELFIQEIISDDRLSSSSPYEVSSSASSSASDGHLSVPEAPLSASEVSLYASEAPLSALEAPLSTLEAPLSIPEASASGDSLLPSSFVSRCGKCHRCLDACPSPTSCLNYWLIEYRGETFPDDISSILSSPEMHGCFYGCDRCLRACPHLRVDATSEDSFCSSPALQAMTPADWLTLTPEDYRTLFRHSAVRRVKYEALMRNIRATLSHLPSSEQSR
ncbi:MAG: DUF1730 domain-containing protein [Bacteroidales bacterium]|nr:DUF1730 domain-containing protein [Candidatus Physcousia equi]